MNNTVKRVCYVCHKKLNADRLQETDSFIQKSLTLAQVNRDPKRRRSTLVTEIKGELTWKAPGKGWVKGYFSVSDMVLYVQKGRKVSVLLYCITFDISNLLRVQLSSKFLSLKLRLI